MGRGSRAYANPHAELPAVWENELGEFGDYLEIRAQLSENTQRSYLNDLRGLIEFFLHHTSPGKEWQTAVTTAAWDQLTLPLLRKWLSRDITRGVAIHHRPPHRIRSRILPMGCRDWSPSRRPERAPQHPESPAIITHRGTARTDGTDPYRYGYGSRGI